MSQPKVGVSSSATRALLYLAGVSLVYVILALVLPPNEATTQAYRLTPGEYHILLLLSGIPRLGVWFAAFFGYTQLLAYARKIPDTPEGRAFAAYGKGFGWFAWGFPFATNLNMLLGGLSVHSPGILATSVIISHYVAVAVAVIAFSYIATGARDMATIHAKLPSKAAIRTMAIITIAALVSYTYATIHTVQNQRPNLYHLPVWLILLTVLVPYLYAWLMGLVAVFVIARYSRMVRGLLYRRPMALVAGGTVISVVMSGFYQYFTLSSQYLRHITFNRSLLVLYIILLLYALGLLLIGIGAKRLSRIEEV